MVKARKRNSLLFEVIEGAIARSVLLVLHKNVVSSNADTTRCLQEYNNGVRYDEKPESITTGYPTKKPTITSSAIVQNIRRNAIR